MKLACENASVYLQYDYGQYIQLAWVIIQSVGLSQSAVDQWASASWLIDQWASLAVGQLACGPVSQLTNQPVS